MSAHVDSVVIVCGWLANQVLSAHAWALCRIGPEAVECCRRDGRAADGMLAQILKHALIRHDSNRPDDSADNWQREILREFLEATLSANARDRFTARQALAQQPDGTGTPDPFSLRLIGQAFHDLDRLQQGGEVSVQCCEELCAEVSATGRASEQELLPYRAQQQWHKGLWGWLCLVCICVLWLAARIQKAAT